jgi:hypothetical protein
MQFDIEIETTVNGAPVRRRVKARQHLADFQRPVESSVRL